MFKNRFLFLQVFEARSFVSNPIIFGNFMKVGAASEDKIYEDINDLKKLKNVLSDVSTKL